VIAVPGASAYSKRPLLTAPTTKVSAPSGSSTSAVTNDAGDNLTVSPATNASGAPARSGGSLTGRKTIAVEAAAMPPAASVTSTASASSPW
jgi:hypothetical protein